MLNSLRSPEVRNTCNCNTAYLAKPLVRYLNTLSGVAAARGPAVTKGSFLAGAHRELSVALIKCQGSVYRGCATLLAKAAGRQVSPGAEVSYED